MEDQSQNTGPKPVDRRELETAKRSVEALKQLLGKENAEERKTKGALVVAKKPLTDKEELAIAKQSVEALKQLLGIDGAAEQKGQKFEKTV